jgi:nitroreductase/FMN reductase [NAD(P)H]
MPEKSAADTIRESLERRFGEAFDVPGLGAGAAMIARMTGRGSARAFTAEPVAPGLVRLVIAAALSAPTKSDLQQRDVLIVEDPALRRELHDIIRHRWLDTTPVLLVFLANNRRQRQLHDWRAKPFANDHLDAFFNAAVDAAIALAACVAAAEAVGLGACPLSQIRNDCGRVKSVLKLPAPPVSPRLPLELTVHTDTFDDSRAGELVAAYDRRRDRIMAYARQRDEEVHGRAEFYGWSEEKARHYARPERADFGRFVRESGFRLE